ncbi:MAG TPA: hypothetical protein VII11_05350 [Bacteroidota bacterium]
MKLESFLRRLSIVLFTALAIFVTVPVIAMTRDAVLRHMNLYSLFVAAMLVSWFIVIRFVLQEFYVRGQLFGGVKRFYENVLAHPVQRLYRLVVGDTRSLNVRFLMIGFIILAVLGLLSYTHALSERALIPLQYQLLQKTVQPVNQSTQSPLAQITLSTSDNNQKRYLEACLKIARDLKQAGARVMLMDFPQNLPQVDQYLELVSELQKTGIVVFGTRPYQGPSHFARLWVAMNPLPGKLDISWGHYTLEEKELSYSHSVDQFVPYRYIDSWTGDTTPDVTLEVLRKYSGAVAIEDHENVVNVGNYSLPISTDGSLYSYRPWNYRVAHAAWFRLDTGEGVGRSPLSKAPYYNIFTGATRIGGFPYQTTLTPTLKGFEDRFRDKIVMIWWNDYGSFSSAFDGIRLRSYAALLDNILTGTNLVRKAESAPLYLTLLGVLLCGLLARYLRGLYAVPLMLLVGVGLFFGAVWLLQDQQILLDSSYPVVAVILSIAAFPLARFAWTMRVKEPMSAPALAFEPPPVEHVEQTSIAFSGKRLSFSLPVAIAIILISIAGSAGITSLMVSSQPKQAEPEVIVLPTLPPIEVQGYYGKAGN